MTTQYGLTTSGFVIKTLSQIQTEFQQSYQAAFGQGIPLGGDSLLGQLIGIHSEREAELWELAQAVYLSAFPDTATDTSLAQAVTLTGQYKLGATYSTVTAVLTGTPGTVIPSGFQASVTGTGAVFATPSDLTLDVTGSGNITLVAQSVGAIAVPAGTLTTIVTPIAGLTSITNPADAAVGRSEETDAQLRARRAQSLIVAQGGSAPAMENAISKVAGVSFSGIRENRTDAVDANGLPPHSLNPIVIGGTDADVANAIWKSKPSGANTFGAVAVQVTDSFGGVQAIYFDRGTSIPIYLIIQLTKDSAYPTDGDTQVRNAILTYGSTFTNGQSVFNWKLVAALNGIPGIDQLTILQGTAPTPSSSANTFISGNQVATFTAQNIAIE